MSQSFHSFWFPPGGRAPKITKAGKLCLLRWCLLVLLVLTSGIVGSSLADETDTRRVDISLSIFPRIVAVDNNFRDKLTADEKAYLLFVYDKDKEYAERLAERMKKSNANIGGMQISTKTISIASGVLRDELPTALFVVERLTDDQLKEVMAFSAETHRLVFSPYLGDVERGVSVGISVTNRVKPYFNLSSLRKSKVSINALLMKMSKRHE
jgi:hypothetical protein